jgi:hypothetical protein
MSRLGWTLTTAGLLSAILILIFGSSWFRDRDVEDSPAYLPGEVPRDCYIPENATYCYWVSTAADDSRDWALIAQDIILRDDNVWATQDSVSFEFITSHEEVTAYAFRDKAVAKEYAKSHYGEGWRDTWMLVESGNGVVLVPDLGE